MHPKKDDVRYAVTGSGKLWLSKDPCFVDYWIIAIQMLDQDAAK